MAQPDGGDSHAEEDVAIEDPLGRGVPEIVADAFEVRVWRLRGHGQGVVCAHLKFDNA